jgi:transglutaminase-like putative cysteine protease
MSQVMKPAILWTSWALALLTSLAVFFVRCDVALDLVWVSIELAASIAVFFAVRWASLKSAKRQPLEKFKPSRFLMVAMAVAMLLPLVRFVFGRWTQNNPEAYELVALMVLQNVAFLLTSLSVTRRWQWLSVCLSSFLMLFCLTMTDRSFLMPLVVTYAVVGIWWLMSSHWNDVERGFVAQQNVPLVSFRLTTMIVLGLVVIATTWAFAPRNFIVQTLAGFMPTSGGDMYADAGARSGVGDGDMLVAADQDASTFGPVESELFLESTDPSLYDMMTESFGEAMQRKRKSEKAVSLQGIADETKKAEHESKKSGREFSTVRKPTKGTKKNISSQPSDAVLYVKGNRPLHLRLESYDKFDGAAWTNSQTEINPQAYAPKLERHDLKPWIRIAEYSRETHHPVPRVDVVKVINLKSPRVVSPPSVTHVHIDKVDRPDFFGWTPDGQISMLDRDHVPQLTVLRLASQTPILHRYRHESAAEIKRAAYDPSSGPSEEAWMRHRSTAESWTAECKNDWQRVEAIAGRLRSSFVVDSEATVPEECDDAVQYFLEQGRGPEYQFASTAAFLLRTIGIPARMAVGFYAKPERYDAKAGQIVVERSDVHVWIEVLRDNCWLAVEPTPGYEPPTEHRSWVQWATQLLLDGMRWIESNWVLVAASVVSLVVMVAWRSLIAIHFWAVVCWLLSRQKVASRIVWTVRFLEGQAWLEGSPRGHRQTVKSWLSNSVFPPASHAELGRELDVIIQGFQHLCYAPSSMALAWLSDHRQQLDEASSRMIQAGAKIARRRAMQRMQTRFANLIARLRGLARPRLMRTSQVSIGK